MRHLRLKLLLSIGLLLLSPFAWADSWSFPAKLKRVEHAFGEIRVVEIVDSRKNQQYPDFSVEVWRGRTLLAKYPGMGFQKIFAAPDNSLIVGISNRGLPWTAAFILRGDGKLLLEAKHGLVAFAYCDFSVTVVREWFDEENPAVEFVKDETSGSYNAIRLRTCDGRQVDLIEEVLKAYHRAVEQTAAEVEDDVDPEPSAD